MYVTGTDILVRRERGLWRRSVAPIEQGKWNGTDLKTASIELPQPQRARQRRNLHVYLGSALCQFMVTTLPQGLRNEHERLAAAKAQMMHRLGLNVEEWQFTLDDSAQAQGRIACSVRQALMAQLRSLSEAYKLTLVSVRPFASVVWNTLQMKASSTACSSLLVVEEDALTLFASASGTLESISTLMHGREIGLIDREVRRLALAVGAEERPVHLVLPAHLDSMAPAFASQALRGSDYLKNECYADFRDLLFRSTAEGNA